MAVSTHGAAQVAQTPIVRERPAPPVPPLVAFWRRFGTTVITIINVSTFLALWEWAVASGTIPALFVPRPTVALQSLIDLGATGQLWVHLGFSAQNFAVGFALAALVGVPLGLLMGASRGIDAVLGPYVWTLYATPRIALAPLFILWLGFSVESKVLLIFLSGLMPILISSMDGVKTVDPSLLRAARVFGASKWQLYLRVVLPFTVPFVMTGLRQGVGRAMIGLLVSEMFGSGKGIGYVISRAGQQMDSGTMFAMLIVLVAASVTLVYVMAMLERLVAPWRVEVKV